MKPNERLKMVRERLGYTQSEMAKKIEMQTSSYNQVELGHNAITPRVKYPLQFLFKVNTRWLMEGVGEMFMNKEKGELPVEILDNKVKAENYILGLQNENRELKEELERYKKIVDKLT